MKQGLDKRRGRWRSSLALAALVGATALLGALNEPPKDDFPADWFYGSPEQRAKHQELMGKEAPEVDLAGWMNVDPEVMNVEDGFSFEEDTKGKVVLIDYWATW